MQLHCKATDVYLRLIACESSCNLINCSKVPLKKKKYAVVNSSISELVDDFDLFFVQDGFVTRFYWKRLELELLEDRKSVV